MFGSYLYLDSQRCVDKFDEIYIFASFCVIYALVRFKAKLEKYCIYSSCGQFVDYVVVSEWLMS